MSLEPFRSRFQEVFCKKCVLKNFAKIHSKVTMPESLFNNVTSLRSATFLKKTDSGTGIFL